MRMVELNTYCGSGSTGRIALDIADYAANQGADTIIGFGTGAVTPEAEIFALRIGGRTERKWHGAIRKFFDMEGYGSQQATRRLIAFLKEYQPDVIHLHNIHGCYVNHRLLFSYLRISNIPVLWTLHDCWPFTGHCAYFDYIGCERWKTGCYRCPQKASYPTCIGLDGSKRNYLRRKNLFTSLPKLMLIAPCEWMKGLLTNSFLHDVPVKVIYNGVNRGLYYPRESKLREKYGITVPYLALAVASEWEERKGFKYLPKLANKLGNDCKLVVIGLSYDQIAALPEGILGLPRTASTRELAQWYSTADCLVNPTMEDNMPLVNLEALACGTPVATFRTGGCPECITDVCGAVVEKGNVETLAKAVIRLCAAKSELRPACIAQAEHFDSQFCAKAYWDVYQEVTQ